MSSAVQNRRLARTLKEWRNQAGYSVERAAEELFCGAGTVSRMESGASAEPLRVKAALELYGAPPEVVTDMVGIANQRRRRTPRPSYYDYVSPALAEYLDLEAEATVMSAYHSEIVAGLVQTERYARSLISSSDELVSTDDVDKLVALRMNRQQRLLNEEPLEFRCILAESTLYNQIGGPAVLRDQVRHLIDVARNIDNVELRVMPFAAGTYAAFGGNFTIMEFRDPDGTTKPELVYAENPLFFVMQESEAEVDLARRIHEDVWHTALDPEASIKLMGRIMTKLRKS